MRKIIVMFVLSLLILVGCDTYKITCYDIDNPENIKTWTEKQPNRGFAEESAMTECHSGISDTVIKVERINE